jgi:hypothetical protein
VICAERELFLHVSRALAALARPQCRTAHEKVGAAAGLLAAKGLLPLDDAAPARCGLGKAKPIPTDLQSLDRLLVRGRSRLLQTRDLPRLRPLLPSNRRRLRRQNVIYDCECGYLRPRIAEFRCRLCDLHVTSCIWFRLSGGLGRVRY